MGLRERRDPDLEMERVDTHCLKGKVVVVEPGNVQMKLKLERLVVKHGGKVEQNVRPGHTSLYIETGMTIKARNVVDQQVVDVIRSSWLVGRERGLWSYQRSSASRDCVGH